jgi:glucose-6-phosphate 1-dehydrogenase
MKNFHKLPEKLPPTILTIFGATGDLSAEYLLPALHHMDMEGLLPDDFRLVCVGRREFTTEEYLDFVVKKSKYLKNLSKGKARKHFLKHLTYFQGDFEKPESFKDLAVLLEDKDVKQHECYNRLYYFATSPQLFAQIANILKTSGLLMSCSQHSRQTRVLVEKPFGFNLESAQALNHLLLKYFSEEQIYRIDHYVGKETVQNLIVARFGNSIFEPFCVF